MPKRCLIYVRVSTAEQAGPGHHSLAAQEALCRQYADSQQMQIVEVLRDEGFSGRTTNRPGLRRLYDYLGAQPPVPIETILVQDTSRMGRDTTEYLLFRRQLRERGIDLVAVTQPNIDGSPEGRLMDTIFAGINQYQSEEKGRRIAIAMHKKFEDGWWPSIAPLGYRNVDIDGRRRVEPDPDHFPLIQLAFAEYATGSHSQGALLDLLTDKGLRTRAGQAVSRTTFNQALANPFYWGLLLWNGQQRLGKHRPATDRPTWQQCQAVTAAHNHYMSRMRKHVFLLSGLTRCGACGNPHTHSVVAAKGNRYYHCKSTARCEQPYIPQKELERQVAELVRSIRLTDEFIERLLRQVKLVWDDMHANDEAEVASLLRRRQALRQQRQVAEQKLLSGVLTDEAFHRVMPGITADLATLDWELAAREQDRQLDTDALRRLLQFARDIPSAYGQAPPLLKKQYIQFFFRELVVRDKQIVKTVPTEFFGSLVTDQAVRLGDGQVRFRFDGCTSLNSIRTFVALIAQPEWIQQQFARLNASAQEAL